MSFVVVVVVVVKQLSQRVGIHTNFMFCQHLAMLCQGLKPAPVQQAIGKLARRKERGRAREREGRGLCGLPHALIRFLKCCQKCSGNFQSKNPSAPCSFIGIPFVSSSSGTLQSPPPHHSKQSPLRTAL